MQLWIIFVPEPPTFAFPPLGEAEADALQMHPPISRAPVRRAVGLAPLRLPKNGDYLVHLDDEDEDSDASLVVQLEHAPHRPRHRVPCSRQKLTYLYRKPSLSTLE